MLPTPFYPPIAGALMELRSCQDKTTRAVARYGRLVSRLGFCLALVVTVDSADS